ncbi:MAG: hypothetical protein BWX87_02530 [Bacteroidetes bacterium ADurb.Bin123]|nr:MAG: hypothetical protein BWX87_02530 [Bacteroidetes bacterium ADurb.Bin123]
MTYFFWGSAGRVSVGFEAAGFAPDLPAPDCFREADFCPALLWGTGFLKAAGDSGITFLIRI